MHINALNDASRRRPPLILLIVVVAVGLAACRSQSQKPPRQAATVDTAAVIASIDSLRAAYENAFAAGDVKKMATLLTDDGRFVQPGGAQWDSMRAASKGPFPSGATLDISPMEVRVLSKDWAYELGTATLAYTPKGPGKERTLPHTYLLLLRKTPEGWKAHREVASSHLPADNAPEQ